MLRIDRHTDYDTTLRPIEAHMAEGERKRLVEAAAADKYGDGGFWCMPLGDLFAIYDGNASVLFDNGGRTVFDVYRAIGFSAFVDKLVATLKSLTLPPLPEELRKRQGVPPTTFEEGVRIFCRDWFGLPNYKAVDALTVTDLVIARKADYCNAVVNRNIASSTKKGGAK